MSRGSQKAAAVTERLHKLLAQHGLGSRRELEKWMLEGRVLLNDRPARPGDRYQSGDRVFIDGREVTSRLRTSPAPRVILYHKPQGQPILAAGAEEQGRAAPLREPPMARKSVMESLPAIRGLRWLVVNTMQAADSGLLLLTSDGRLADALRRRAETMPAAYVARVLVPFPEFDAGTLPRVVHYDEGTVEFELIEPAGGEGTNRWFRVESRRSHRRAAVRALFESRGLKVSRVIQVSLGDLELPRDLPRGRSRALTEEQIAALYARAGLPLPPDEQAAARAERTHRRLPPDRRKSAARAKAGARTARAATQRPPRTTSTRSSPRSDDQGRSGRRSEPRATPRRASQADARQASRGRTRAGSAGSAPRGTGPRRRPTGNRRSGR